MAVASSRAGQVLAQPLFCRLNVHMRILNTCEVDVQELIRAELSRKMDIMQILCTDLKVTLNYGLELSVILGYLMAIPY